MKKIILLAVLLISTANFAQKKRSGRTIALKTNKVESADSVSVSKAEWKNYIALSVSMSSGKTYDTNENKYTFSESAYPSLEFGFSKGNLAAGLAIGTRSFKDTNGQLGNYYAEVRITPSFPLGIIDANVVFGAGSYFVSSKGTFIEYGSGISYTKGNYTYGIGYSNWDGVDYIYPSLSYSF